MNYLFVAETAANLTITTAREKSHLLQIFWGSDPVVKLTLFVLIGFSVLSWAVIINKYRQFKFWKSSSARFFDIFLKTEKLEDISTKLRWISNPLVSIFKETLSDLSDKTGKGKRVSNDVIRRKIERLKEDEIENVERYIPFLATTANTTPFIGLFGTVWGILTAFWQIGRAGSSSLAIVGPYIAEALIATAMGLAAAIPAVIFYNYFVARVRTFSREIENFSEDLYHRIEQEHP